MKIKPILIILLAILVLAACAPASEPEPNPTVTPDVPEIPTQTPPPSPTITEAPPDPLTLEEVADTVVKALADKDFETVAEFVHPEMGVRFSPYTYVQEGHLVFMPDELPGLVGSDQVYLWGYYDGSGHPIELTFDDYYQEFVYSADFSNPEEMAVDEELGWSSMINNIAEFYPGSSFVEYHFSGFEEDYGGLDWASLRLVFTEEDGVWYLVGIVNDQWTI